MQLCTSRLFFHMRILSPFCRTFTTTPALCKNKRQRLKVYDSAGAASKKKSAGSEAALAASKDAVRIEYDKYQARQEALAHKQPIHAVHLTRLYPFQRHSMADVVQWHREFVADPNMLATPGAYMWATFTINCRTKKKTKFLQQLPLVFLLPKPLTFLPPKNVLAFCSDAVDIAMAIEAGAFDAGDKELISKVEHGQYNYEAFDHVVCHRDMLPQVSKLKSVLRDKLPLAKSEQVGTDMEQLVKLYKNGAILEMTKSATFPEVGTMKVLLGTLEWSTEDLTANIETYAKAILDGGADRVQGKLIESIVVRCPPSDEEFHVKLDLVDNYVIKVKERPTKKGAASASQEIEEPDEDAAAEGEQESVAAA